MITSPDDKAPLVSHLIELRDRLVRSVLAIMVGFLLCYAVAEELFTILVLPLRNIMGAEAKMIYTGLHEAFFTYLKVAFYGGLFLAIPVILNQLWRFVAPGLYQHEQKMILPFLVMTPVLFFVGGAFAYFLVFPAAFSFFLSYVTPTIEALPSLREYLSLVISMMFAFGLAFETPIILLLLIASGTVSVATLVDKRRYSIVMAFIIGAILTPPDAFSQVLLAVPLMAMYEISIIGGRLIEKRRPAPTEEPS